MGIVVGVWGRRDWECPVRVFARVGTCEGVTLPLSLDRKWLTCGRVWHNRGWLRQGKGEIIKNLKESKASMIGLMTIRGLPTCMNRCATEGGE